MTLLLLFFSLFASADDLSTERYCYRSPEAALRGRDRFNQIKVLSDQDSLEGPCLIVVMRPHRRELIQKYLLSLYPELQITFSSAEVSREPCRLRVEKFRAKKSDTVSGGVSPSGASLSASEQMGTANEILNIETLGAFEFSFNDFLAKGSCQYITPKQYRIVLELRKSPRPMMNTGIDQANKELPPDQESGVIKTELQLIPGQKVNVAHLVKGTSANKATLNIKEGSAIISEQGQQEETVFLMIQ